jgi:hypothetical protein
LNEFRFQLTKPQLFQVEPRLTALSAKLSAQAPMNYGNEPFPHQLPMLQMLLRPLRQETARNL